MHFLRPLRAVAIAGALTVAGASSLIWRTKPARALGAPSAKPAAGTVSPHPVGPGALEKTVLGVDVPTARNEFSVSPDGKQTYFADGSAYYVFDESGDEVGRMSTKGYAHTLAVLPDGRFISAQNGVVGHVGLLGPEGTELRSLVTRGAVPQNLRPDKTGWTTPVGLAFDAIHQLLFVLDTSMAPRGAPDPEWSRIAVFDADGKYLRDIAAYDGSKGVTNDALRTWYDDIEVDPKRSVLYVTARTARELWAFDYYGALRGKVPGAAGIAVFPNSNVAVVDPDKHHVRIYDSSLHLVTTLASPSVLDLEADAAGRLYASVNDPSVLYVRWPANFSEPTTIRPKFEHISVRVPFDAATVGSQLSLPVSIIGRPTPRNAAWHVFARPSDGSDLTWRELDATYADGALTVRPGAEIVGLNDIAVRYGDGEIGRAEGVRDLHVEKTITFRPPFEAGSVSVRSLSGRSGFQRGEAIPIRIEARGAAPGATGTLAFQRAGKTLASTPMPAFIGYWELPATVTRRLLPGHYSLNPNFAALASIPYEFDIAEVEPDSPVQRIVYHEFDPNPASWAQPAMTGVAERLAFIRDYIDSVAGLGFTRETDRSALKLMNTKAAGTWRTDTISAPSAHDLLPLGGAWEPEAYLDRAAAAGIHYDTQLLTHCSGVRLAANWFPPLNGTLQHLTQWFGKYPSFYGFNYNDEIFFTNFPWSDSTPADTAWLNATATELAGHPTADSYRAGLTHMYSEFDRAVEEIRPDLARTATPMWQYPAVDGSYAPTIYAHMTESYSHYLSEGFGWPWYPAHSAEILRRPGLPLMAVFDNGYATGDGESYLKDALQVLGRGVQGFGVEHEHPLRDARGSNALRVMNGLAEMYGSIFAEAEPDNEATVLYSYAQDVTEKRDLLGTPHWERVLALYGAGLMAGLPMSIAYEEDVAAGALLASGKPKTKLMFLVGQTAELPTSVRTALRAFSAAGGQVVIDADSRDYPGAVRFQSTLLGPAQAAHKALDNDALFPDTQPAYEAIATALNKQFGPGRRFLVDTDDPWVSKNRFDAGAIHYVLIASETSPYPWDAASLWSLGTRFSKSYWPKRVQLTVPRTPVIYDVFERRVVPGAVSAKGSLVQADLTAFPGKLYALAPRVLEAPKLGARMSKDTVTYSVNAGMAARIPLRIALSDGHGTTSTLFRGTDLSGKFEHTVARPAGPGPWQLEVSELLGGASSSLTIPAIDLPQAWVTPLPVVETEREPQIRELVRKAPRNLRIVGSVDALPRELRASLLQTLKTKGLSVTLETAPTTAPAAQTYLVLATMAGKGPGELMQAANQAGLLGRNLGDSYPGAGRGFVSAAFAPRAYGENCLAVIGGDERGLELATRRFIALLNNQALKPPPDNDRGPAVVVAGTPLTGVDIPKLSERVGVRLSGIRASRGKLALTANGYLANLARVDDEGDHGRVIAVSRVGESPVVTSLFASNDGKSYGAAARTVQRFGEAFSLSSVGSTPDVFTSFGNAAPYQHVFSASGDASTVLAPGPYGVVAWRRKANAWQEAWSVDYWKKFDSLDWPVSAGDARIPSFDTLVPKDGDIALIEFAELTNDGWLGSGTTSTADVTARSLKNGQVRWHFAAPITGSLVLPKLYSNSDGSLVVLQAQLGTSGAFRYYVLDRGQLVGSWGSDAPPLSFDVSDRTGRVVTAFGNGSRLLEVRMVDGSVAFSRTWHSQPLAILFAEDGMSVFVSDDAGMLSRLDAHGDLVWQVQLGCSAELAQDGARLYAAGWDGRLRAFTTDGHERWKLDLTGPMSAILAKTSSEPAALVHEPARPASATPDVPKGANLLRSGQATLIVGGTRAWKSSGTVQVQASALTNGSVDDVSTPWVTPDDLYWNGTASRKVWAEVGFKQPTNVHSLTVYENPKFPESWPTETLIQVWDDFGQRWRTAKRGIFLRGPVATYTLDLKHVSKLRYLPWSDYFRNFHTSEIEVR